MTLMPCAAAGDSIAGAISADVETAAAARAVKTVCFSMTCLLYARVGPMLVCKELRWRCRFRALWIEEFAPLPRPDLAMLSGRAAARPPRRRWWRCRSGPAHAVARRAATPG